MTTTLSRGGQIAAFLLLLLLAACAAPPKRALDPAARSVPERDAIVVVPQGEIRVFVPPSNAGAASGGGLIGALIDVGINQIRTNSAEEAVRPVRDGLAGYDFDRKALEGVRAAAPQIDWLHIQNFVFTKDASNDQILARFDQSNADQLLVASYEYTFSIDFKQLSILLRAGLYPKVPPQGVQPDHRLARGNELYEQQFVFLANTPPKGDKDQNIAYWTANNAQATRVALDSGIAKVDELLVRSLSQSPDAAVLLDGGADTKVLDRHGALVERGPNGTLIYQKDSGTWVFGHEGDP
ncbi:MAG TPA: hypothetical protein VG328_11915 [Stellaceae bacterium]|jgi:hypothetical protein|nr:hypothetical protein [Stellaceae bacterium]